MGARPTLGRHRGRDAAGTSPGPTEFLHCPGRIQTLQASPPLVLINAVGLTAGCWRWRLGSARPAEAGWAPLREVIPAVTCTAQASLLTGLPPERHGIVGNGWLFRDTGEVRFWQQSNALIQAEPIYVTAREAPRQRGRTFKTAKLFWWFNQGAAVDFSVTPKPYYGADGNKVFGITGPPEASPNASNPSSASSRSSPSGGQTPDSLARAGSPVRCRGSRANGPT